MLDELCRELKNWFDVNRNFDVFTISDGVIDLSGTNIQAGQYFRIVGSVFNDGVYKYEPVVIPTEEHPETHRPVLTDETFDGAVWAMAVPPAVIALAAEIEAWQAKYGGAESASMSPFNSESFGGYSYSKGSRNGTGTTESGSGTWQGAFANRLNQWRKIRP